MRNLWMVAVLLAACSNVDQPLGPLASTTSRTGAVRDASATWHQLAADGAGPTGIGIGAGKGVASALAEQERAVYVLSHWDFLPGSVWRFSLRNDSWSEVPTTGFPIGKFRQIVHDPRTHELLTFWDGLGQVYAVSEDGGAWHPVGTQPNSDSYYESGAFWDPVADRLTTFGGYGLLQWQNTIWSFDPESQQWQAQSTNGPAAWPRIAPEVAVDWVHRAIYITGGEGNESGSQAAGGAWLNDLSRYDLTTHEWQTLIAPPGVGDDAEADAARLTAGLTIDAPRQVLYRFGGVLPDGSFANDLAALDLRAVSPRWAQLRSSGEAPTPRRRPSVVFDQPGHRLIVIGGETKAGWVADVWALNVKP